MKDFRKIIAVFIVISVVLFAAANCMINLLDSLDDKSYLVELNRAKYELYENGNISAENYKSIIGVYVFDETQDFYNTSNEYIICDINGTLYRIEYEHSIGDKTAATVIVNSSLAVFSAAMLAVLLYLERNIIKPFEIISELPYELAKGNLTVPLRENKKRYFGKFIWGLDMLREKLESANIRRLEQARKEKTFILSLSHDIKTPLAAVKLYSQALSKGLYNDERRKNEVIQSIGEKADEIERLLNELVENNSDEFMEFEINNSDFYISEVIDNIKDFYCEKLKLKGTELLISDYSDCMLCGDPDRLTEVLQNIFENAIKYGDGRRITVSFSDEEDYRLISVRNTGCTLNDTELAHIFDSFWRGSNVGSKEGSGLGLYICRKIMTKMHGDIFAKIQDGDMAVIVVCRKI